MSQAIKAALVGFAAANAWVGLAWLIFVQNAGSRPAGDPVVVATWALLVIAPAVTFVPLARALHAPLYDLEGIAGWATFGYVITFVTPGATLSRAEFLMFLLPLTVVIATVATLVAFAFNCRVYRDSPHRISFLQARRQGYIVGLAAVALFLLHGVQLLSLVNGLLLVVVAVLCEVVMLSRGRPGPVRALPHRPQPRSG